MVEINLLIWTVNSLRECKNFLVICYKWRMAKNHLLYTLLTLYQGHFYRILSILNKTIRQRELLEQEMRNKMTFWDFQEWMWIITTENMLISIKMYKDFSVSFLSLLRIRWYSLTINSKFVSVNIIKNIIKKDVLTKI